MSTDTAEEVASVLQERLSTLIDLSLILKHIHWNVVGMGFVAVHELMDQQTASVRVIDKVYESVTSAHRSAIEEVSELDPVTEDLLIGQAGELEMAHWFVRAHISNVGGELATAGADTQLDAAVTAAADIQPGVDLTDEDTDTESTSPKSKAAGRSA
jgi:starvation-inducible DNA-binding protein